MSATALLPATAGTVEDAFDLDVQVTESSGTAIEWLLRSPSTTPNCPRSYYLNGRMATEPAPSASPWATCLLVDD
jgi:hypothetical protein